MLGLQSTTSHPSAGTGAGFCSVSVSQHASHVCRTRIRVPQTLRSGHPAAARLSRPLVASATAAPGAGLVGSVVDFLRRILTLPPVGLAAEAGESMEEPGPPLAPRLRVAVVGATGRTGRIVARSLVEAGHQVVALVSSESRAKEILESCEGLPLGSKEEGGKVELVQGALGQPSVLRALVAGTDAVISCVAARYGPEGYLPESSPEDVYWKGICNLVRVAAEEYGNSPGGSGGERRDGASLTLFDFSSCRASAGQPTNGAANGVAAAADLGAGGQLEEEEGRLGGWGRLDDVIMGGQSESFLRAGDGFAVFEGIVRVEGGGFCGSRASFPDGPVDASGYDGLKLRVRGDGQRYKLNLRDTAEKSEFQYQASFDTVRGQWVDVFVPFNSFRGVARARSLPEAPALNTAQLHSVGLLLSRFQYNGFPNPLFTAGPFRLEVESISMVRQPLTQVVLLSSAAVERSARAGTEEERQASIPIVKLNPGGVLSWKLSGEDALRASGLRYTIVRPCGLTDKDLDQPFLLESAQGDAITGLISRQEAAQVCVAALDSPDAVNKTFEVRRDELSRGLQMEERHWRTLFSGLRPDVQAPPVVYPAVPAEVAATAAKNGD